MSEEVSLLVATARQQGINLSSATPAQKALVYRLTVQAIEVLLDASDRTQLTPASLGVIRKDIRDILVGLRDLAEVKSATAVSTFLRKARDKLDSAQSYLDNGKKTDPYYERLTKAQEFLAQALENF